MLRSRADTAASRDERPQDTDDNASADADTTAKERKTRTRSGCLNCRRRRRKCDEARPTCLNCAKRNERCERGVRLTFRAENAQTLPEDAAAAAARPRKRPRRYEIRDVTSDVVDEYHAYSPTMDLNAPSIPPIVPHEPRKTGRLRDGIGSAEGHFVDEDTTRSASGIPISQAPAFASEAWLIHSHTADHNERMQQEHEQERSVLSARNLQRRMSNLSSTGRSDICSTPNPQTESAAENLLFLRNVHQPEEPANPTSSVLRGDEVVSPTFSSPINQITPDSLLDDGVFLPGSTYKELHTTLRQHLIDETTLTSQLRQYSPAQTSSGEEWLEQRRSLLHNIDDANNDGASYSGQTPPMELSSEEECRLWKNWIDEIAGWLDKFDHYRHFQHTLPVMAKTCHHLRFSMLAVSARQIELKNAFKPTDQSLALYQQAIHLLVPQLHLRTTEVIASCVVLCVLEMLSCSPKAWRRHLDGCANLIQAVGITGFSGGVEQALFWCFARMDVCGGLIDSMKTLIPVGQWASKIDLDADIGMFRTQVAFDGYANHAVYLCARVVELLSDVRDRRSRSSEKPFIYRWSKLWRYIQDWQSRRPAEMYPVSIIVQPTVTPFSTILYSNPAATSGNQLFHTAAILMLQNKPSALRLDHKPQPVQWHARQICGISLSNDHHGAWTNSIQPLWIAGKCMSKPEEHAAILDHLQKIEAESGWGTKWRIEDLKEHWEIEYG